MKTTTMMGAALLFFAFVCDAHAKPAVMGHPATNITTKSATLNGQLTEDDGNTCQYRFRYKKKYGSVVFEYTSWTGSAHEDDSFAKTVSGLDLDTEYLFQCQARYTVIPGLAYVESEWSNTVYFKTDDIRPEVVAVAATNVEQTTATLNGRLTNDKGGNTCKAKFRYRKAGDTAWTETAWAGSLHTGDNFSKNIDGLSPGTKYEFGCQAMYTSIVNVPVVGDWSSTLQFTTLPPPSNDPVTVTLPASNVMATSATLNGRLTEDAGHICEARFRYRKSAATWQETSWKGSLHKGDSFSQALTGFTPATQYEYQCQARYTVIPSLVYHEGDWSSSSSATFITPPLPSDDKPVIVTLSALLTRCGYATLRGRLDSDGGQSCQVRFGYNGGLPQYTSWQTKTPGDCQAEIAVTPGQRYTFWAEAKNAAGTTIGGNQTFKALDGVLVPKLIGKTKTEAEAALRAVGLVLGTVSGDLSGKVTSQSPRAGTEVCAGSAVAITLSQQTATVPDVVGMSEGEARATLTAAGFVAHVSYGPSDEAPGTVFKQDPAGGTVAPQGSEVDLTVSQRPVYPLAHWKLDEAAGTTAFDAVGRHHGMVRGNLLWLPDGGMIDGALWLDGVGDYVEVADHPDFSLTTGMTATAWIKVDAFDKEWQTIVSKGDSAWRLHRNGLTDQVGFHITRPAGDHVQADGLSNVNDGDWHHVAGTYDGGTVRLYVDGEPEGSAPSTGPIATNHYRVMLGENDQARNRYWTGVLDDVRIYSEALSQDQVWAVMAGSDSPVPLVGKDIGTSVSGSNSYADGVYIVTANGADIWGYRDEFRYLSMAVTGDFEFIAHVLSIENTDPWAKAGVMVRETLDPASRHAFMCVTPEDGEGRFAFQCRPVTGGLSTSLHSPQGQVFYPTNTWVKIKREGNAFTALTSQDGVVWATFPGPEVDLQGYPSAPNPVTIDLPETVYIGLAVTSHSNGLLCVAEFDNVRINSEEVTP
ncbi:MAG: LamG-like jellyroll fold domain-containing protein [Phycisphaerales bacterium]